jgi:signal transduction histidine kinase
MTTLRIPPDLWDWRCTAFALLVAATPLLSLSILLADHQGWLQATANVDGLALAPAATLSAMCLYLGWKLTGRSALAWLATGTTVAGLQGITMLGLQLADARQVVDQSFWMAMADISVLLAILALAIPVSRQALNSEPAVIGILGGLALGLLRLVAVSDFGWVDLGMFDWWLIVGCWLVFSIPPIWCLARASTIPPWARWRMASSVGLFSLGHLATYLDGPSRSVGGSLVTVVAELAGAILLVAGSVALVREVMVDDQARADDLQVRLDEMEAGIRKDRARIHEINSTIAGVLSASRLLQGGTADAGPEAGSEIDEAISAERRRLLEGMINAELSRLERLLNEPLVVPRPRTIDLDHTISNLVLAQEARGNRIKWLPSGACVTGQPDDVAEVLNILLDNAAKHGSAEASVTVQEVTDAIEILVSDTGPGVAPELRSQLFEWGARGPRSHGQGIGLNIAADLTRKQGGYLRLRQGNVGGATFVVGLPVARRDGDEPAHLS